MRSKSLAHRFADEHGKENAEEEDGEDHAPSGAKRGKADHFAKVLVTVLPMGLPATNPRALMTEPLSTTNGLPS